MVTDGHVGGGDEIAGTGTGDGDQLAGQSHREGRCRHTLLETPVVAVTSAGVVAPVVTSTTLPPVMVPPAVKVSLSASSYAGRKSAMFRPPCQGRGRPVRTRR
jgi:hypothetical protein